MNTAFLSSCPRNFMTKFMRMHEADALSIHPRFCETIQQRMCKIRGLMCKPFSWTWHASCCRGACSTFGAVIHAATVLQAGLAQHLRVLPLHISSIHIVNAQHQSSMRIIALSSVRPLCYYS